MESGKKKKTDSNLMSTFKLLKEPKLLLILPIVTFTGMEQAFASADFTVVRHIRYRKLNNKRYDISTMHALNNL